MERLCKIACVANPIAAVLRLFLSPLLAIIGFSGIIFLGWTPAWGFGTVGAGLLLMIVTSPDWNNHMHFPGESTSSQSKN